MSSQAINLEEEFCPNCGNFVSSLNDTTGFCLSCSPQVVGDLLGENPTSLNKPNRLENWLKKNAEDIEERMLSTGSTAKVVISEIAQERKARCRCCGNVIPHGTHDRHVICNKNPNCKKARRYYSYLKYEKGLSKDKALEQTIAKFKK